MFDNYKVLCDKLELQQKTGKSKQLQLKELARHCEYHKQGNKFVIDKVYRKPKEKVDSRGGNNSIFADKLDRIVLSCVKSGTYTLENIFMEQIPILTKRYDVLLKIGYQKYAEDNKILGGVVKEYSEKLYRILMKAIESSLNRLQKQGKLEFKKRIQATTPTGKKILTNKQVRELRKIEGEIYAELDITLYQRISNKKINTDFKRKVCNKMEIKMSNYCTVYDITQLTKDSVMLDSDIQGFTDNLIIRLHKAIIKVEIDGNKPYRTKTNLETIKMLDNRFINNATEDWTNFCFARSYAMKILSEIDKKVENNIRDIENGIPF